jgi:hypothetical protein
MTDIETRLDFLPNDYILVNKVGDTFVYISCASKQVTFSLFNVGDLIEEDYNNYVKIFNEMTNSFVEVYHYDKKNLPYALFLYKYPLNVVYDVLNQLEKIILLQVVIV